MGPLAMKMLLESKYFMSSQRRMQAETFPCTAKYLLPRAARGLHVLTYHSAIATVTFIINHPKILPRASEDWLIQASVDWV